MGMGPAAPGPASWVLMCGGGAQAATPTRNGQRQSHRPRQSTEGAAGACDSEHTPEPNDRTRVYRTYTEVCTQAYTKVQSTRRVGAAVAV